MDPLPVGVSSQSPQDLTDPEMPQAGQGLGLRPLWGQWGVRMSIPELSGWFWKGCRD